MATIGKACLLTIGYGPDYLQTLDLHETISGVDAILDEVEAIIKSKSTTNRRNGFKDFSGIWTEKETEDIKRINEASCFTPVDVNVAHW